MQEVHGRVTRKTEERHKGRGERERTYASTPTNSNTLAVAKKLPTLAKAEVKSYSHESSSDVDPPIDEATPWRVDRWIASSSLITLLCQPSSLHPSISTFYSPQSTLSPDDKVDTSNDDDTPSLGRDRHVEYSTGPDKLFDQLVWETWGTLGLA